MRALVMTSTLALSLVLVHWLSGYCQQIPGAAPASALPSSASNDVHVLSMALVTGGQQIVIVDMRQQSMAVYHIQPATGKIELKSVRKIQLDLLLEQFNASEPLPSDMRLLKQ